MNKTINIDGIEIEVIFKKVKNINLHITKEGKVTVSVNKYCNMNKLTSFLNEKSNWIHKNVSKIKEYNHKKEERKNLALIQDEIVSMFGKEYRLDIQKNDKVYGYITDDSIIIYVKDTTDYDEKAKILDKIMKEYLVTKVGNSLDRMLELTKIYNIKRPSCIIRKMKTRWGTCNITKKKITINSELIYFDEGCLDYVMLHELIHFIERRHNTRFYKYIENVMPDYNKKRALLKKA